MTAIEEIVVLKLEASSTLVPASSYCIGGSRVFLKTILPRKKLLMLNYALRRPNKTETVEHILRLALPQIMRVLTACLVLILISTIRPQFTLHGTVPSAKIIM